jgi:hypothetical protein
MPCVGRAFLSVAFDFDFDFDIDPEPAAHPDRSPALTLMLMLHFSHCSDDPVFVQKHERRRAWKACAAVLILYNHYIILHRVNVTC